MRRKLSCFLLSALCLCVSVAKSCEGGPESMDDKFHDECGIFAVYGHPEAAKLAYLGLYAQQHRGQESAGIVSSNGKKIYPHKAMGQVADVFTEVVLKKLRGWLAIGHTR